MMCAGLGILCWIIIRTRAKSRRKAALPVIAGPLSYNGNAVKQNNAFTGTASLGAPQELLKWQVELHDLSRELKAELDSKMIAVRAITLQYDQAAHRLSELIQLAEQTRSIGFQPVDSRDIGDKSI